MNLVWCVQYRRQSWIFGAKESSWLVLGLTLQHWAILNRSGKGSNLLNMMSKWSSSKSSMRAFLCMQMIFQIYVWVLCSMSLKASFFGWQLVVSNEEGVVFSGLPNSWRNVCKSECLKRHCLHMPINFFINTSRSKKSTVTKYRILQSPV